MAEAAKIDSRGGAAQIDARIGYRLQALRFASGMTRAALGECIGISAREVLKHEVGLTRIDAARLITMAHVLGVPVTAFFEGLV